MILYKRGEKYWNFEEEGVFYTPSKFTINTISNDFYIVYENNLKSKKYNVSDVTLTDVVGGGSFTFANADLFMQKLEELNCPCFQKDETTIINPPIDPTDFLSSDLTDYPVATLPIADADKLFIIQNGIVKKVNKSDIVKNSVFFHDNIPVVHNTGTANTVIKSIPILANNWKNGDLYYIRIGLNSTQYSETQLFLNGVNINQPMPQNAINFSVFERHLYVFNNNLYCVTGSQLKEITNSGGVITPINLSINNNLNIYSRLFNGATANYLFFNIQKLN